jgi:hypothetical protein
MQLSNSERLCVKILTSQSHFFCSFFTRQTQKCVFFLPYPKLQNPTLRSALIMTTNVGYGKKIHTRRKSVQSDDCNTLIFVFSVMLQHRAQGQQPSTIYNSTLKSAFGSKPLMSGMPSSWGQVGCYWPTI